MIRGDYLFEAAESRRHFRRSHHFTISISKRIKPDRSRSESTDLLRNIWALVIPFIAPSLYGYKKTREQEDEDWKA